MKLKPGQVAFAAVLLAEALKNVGVILRKADQTLRRFTANASCNIPLLLPFVLPMPLETLEVALQGVTSTVLVEQVGIVFRICASAMDVKRQYM